MSVVLYFANPCIYGLTYFELCCHVEDVNVRI